MLSPIILLAIGLPAAENADTLRSSVVVADKGMVVSHTDTVVISNQINVTEALSGIPGLYVADMGGAAGLKTANLRGLGSTHTAIYLDGVRVNNSQSGQTDLGMLDFGNCSGIVVDYAQNSLSFNTRKPIFGDGGFAGQAKSCGGSFGTYEQSLRLDFRLSDRISLSATSSGTLSKGDFPYGGNLRRENNDVSRIRAAVDLWGLMDSGSWHAKTFFNSASRGTPGSTLLPSAGRQKDRNAFIQGVVHNRFSSLYSLNASAKAAYDDLDYFSEWEEGRHRSSEFQLNTSHIFHAACWLEVSIASDIQRSELESTQYHTGRTSVMSAVTSAFRLRGFNANVSVEYSGTFDGKAKRRNAISPSADILYTMADGLDLVAFARRAYRVPTFNELYFPGYGNPDLKCEDAWLTSLGTHWKKRISNWDTNAGIDIYCNTLKDKIVSSPSEADPGIWLPYNIGKALMFGADIRTGASLKKDDWGSSLSASYSWQNARDKTPGGANFNERIPYIAGHSLTADLNGSLKGWNLDFLWNLRCARTDGNGEMPDYSTLDFTAGKELPLKKGRCVSLNFLVRNITGTRYELSSGYPMPGRAFYGTANLKF